jgi:hypothetical protein
MGFSLMFILTIEFQGLLESNPQCFEQFLFRAFLTVDAGDFLNPSDHHSPEALMTAVYVSFMTCLLLYERFKIYPG